MRIRHKSDRPDKVVFKILYKCPTCKSIMICERGLNRFSPQFQKRKIWCLKCAKVKGFIIIPEYKECD